jgi:hypothetical protein
MNKFAFDSICEMDGPPVVPNSDDILRQLESQNPNNDDFHVRKVLSSSCHIRRII